MTTGPWRPDDTGSFVREAGPRDRWGTGGREPLALETRADRERLVWRARVLEWGVIGLVAVLLLGFWNLQGVQGAHYERLANENLLRRIRIRPPRGLILDRHGEILATNRPSYEVAIVREGIADEDAALAWLGELLDQPPATLRERLDRHRGWPRFRPIVVASDVPRRLVVAIEARRREYPGVVVQIPAQRSYPMGDTAAHVLGQVGEITRTQLDEWAGDYRLGDIVGQNGLERVYNDDLSGTPGFRLAIVNSVGREVSLVEEEPPLPGRNVTLTLDAGLQRRAEALLQGRRGSVVALDVETGGILARFSAEEWTALLGDPALPLQNRALRAAFPPGSIFKIVMAVAGLEEGVISPDTTVFCPGGKTLYGRFFRCQGQHGNVAIVQAIAYSCNTFFYDLGVKLGRERIVAWAQRLGLGAKTGVDLPEEQSGILPSDDWLASVGRRFYPGETVSVSIGQGPIAVSPLQLARLAIAATTGSVHRPHLLLSVEESSGSGSTERVFRAHPEQVHLSESTRRALLRGLAGSVRYGTSARAGIGSLPVGGKTGTAQVASAANIESDGESRPEHLRDHAWFLGVAPIEEPRIAVAVFVEHGQSGGRTAAPIGGQLFATYFGIPADEVGIRQLPVRETPGQ